MAAPLEEVACFVLVAVYLIQRLRSGARAGWIRRFAVIAVAGWLTEDTCIRAYGFYSYDPGWVLMLDRVPLAVIAVWPVVIDSAGRFVRTLVAPGGARLAVLTGLLVLTDAALIEPVSVQGGLWRWFEPGLFGVPPVGILGWGMFAAWIDFCLDGESPSSKRAIVAMVAVPALTHLSLLAVWWGALRWLNHEVPTSPAVVIAWVGSVYVAFRAVRRPLPDFGCLMARAPGAIFFFVLVLARGSDRPWLLAWVGAFALPYAALIAGRFYFRVLRHT